MTGQEIYNLGLKHLGEPYILGSLVPKDLPNYKGPWDCAEFASFIVYQITGRLYGCSNNIGNPRNADAYTGFWGRDAIKLGKKISIEEAIKTPGAFLLRMAGEGLVGHIVCSNGMGGTVEAHSHKDGVIKSGTTGRRWDFGILIPWVKYEVGTGGVYVGPSVPIYRFTIPAMKGPEIVKIQQALSKAGFHIDTDGVFGQETFNAVKGFQYKNGLVADGEVGPKTFSALGISL